MERLSAYAQHSPFDSPTEPDEEAPAAEDSPVNDTTETIDDAQEGGEADDSDL